MFKRTIIIYVCFAICPYLGISQESQDDSLKKLSIENLSKMLNETDQLKHLLLLEMESRILSDTLTTADLIVIINGLLELESAEAYNLIIKYNKRYIRNAKNTSEIASQLVTGKPIYSIRSILARRVGSERLLKFREYLYRSSVLYEPIEEEDIDFYRIFLFRDISPTTDDSLQKIREENLKKIRDQG